MKLLSRSFASIISEFKILSKMDLSSKEIESAKFTFSIYDFDGHNTIDAYYLGPALRALGLTPSLEKIRSFGGTPIKRDKSFSMEEFLAIYADAKKKKDMGTIDDFVECLRSNDKDRCGTISADQLGHILQAYGEKLDPDDVEVIIRECGNPQEGFIAYIPFLNHLLDGPERPDIETNITDNASSSADTDIIVATPVPPPQVKPKLKRTVSKDIDTSFDEPIENVSSAAFGLKTPKVRIPTVTEEPKAAHKVAAAIKPKNQQALIAMKTMAMIGSIK